MYNMDRYYKEKIFVKFDTKEEVDEILNFIGV